ncbi:MAG: hypothetical protein LBJ59_10925 [Zoogloeaceae bacterium]|nr:hypothetical protein [Zoogloeaceae bacterium]
MKSRGKNLNAAYEQLKEYVFHLPAEDMPDVLMVCDFASIVLYYRSTGEKHAFKVKDLKKHIRRFAAIAGYETTRICEHQTEVNVRAAEKMAKLYDALKACGYEGHALEVYLVRLLFCLFADDTGIFPKDSLANYIENAKVDGSDLSEHISRLFETLNLPEETRKKRVLLSPDLLQFRYINGGLFADPLPFADFDAKMRAILLECCRFDWNKIPPAIFGAMFQGVMDEQMRRELGAHYTSEENILKLINPLFMDALRAEFEQVKYDEKRLTQFHDKIAGLRFLDPACGCGNFLMVAYRDLRRLELDILRMQLGALRQRVTEVDSLLKVKVGQFYGIECEDFPCQIAQVGMWLMDHQMNLAVSEAFGAYYARLPLTQSATLVCGNALTLDWEAIVPKTELSYILGNPPFVGASMMSAVQKTDAVSIFGKIKLSNSIDYVGAWYHKTDRFIQDTSIRVAFVSTNSITQGEQVAPLWSKLFSEYNIHIDFCYRTFKWSNEAKGKAAVHCVIIGFSNHPDNDAKIIYENDGSKTRAANINAYLVDAPNILISSRSEPICPVPRMYLGNKPADGGNLILTANEKDEILAKEPQTGKFIKRYLGATEYINGNERYCIWLKDVAFQEVKDCPIILDKIGKVRKFRLKSSAKPTVEKAETPHLFFFISQPDSDYLLVPSTSSEHRKYIPVGYMDKNTISSNANMIIPGATLYHFGILTSSVHMAWTRAICGRLKSDYRYTGVVVYNNFPWPDATAEQTGEISVAAQKPLMQEVCIPKVRLRICTAKIPCRSTRNWSKRIRLWINSSCKSTASPPKPPNPKSSPP